MQLKYNAKESLEVWAAKVEHSELAWAKQEIARGADPAVTAERMAERIVKKMLHPLIKEKASLAPEYDANASRKRYEAAFINRTQPPADHVID
jgi:glutamyl-tRNA reductase